MANLIGHQLGNYRLLRLLGRGGFAEVYLGEHIHLGAQAAIKVLSTHVREQEVEHFRAEGRLIVRLMHPHIVRVLDFDVQQGVPFLIMEYAPNGTLRERHPHGTSLALPLVVSYVHQIAGALQYAHEQQLVHRDVKPDNMLLGRYDDVLLSDFGIATLAHHTSSQSLHAMAGTIPYMAPEQIQGKPRPASDQYALGIVVYEWLTGDRPFQGSFTEIASQHLFASPPPFAQQLSTIPSEVEQVVFTALAKNPKQRFGSVRAFATALEQASQSRQGGIGASQTLPPDPLQPDAEQRNTPTNQSLLLSPNGVLPTRPAQPSGQAPSSGLPGTLPAMVGSVVPAPPPKPSTTPSISLNPPPSPRWTGSRRLFLAGTVIAGGSIAGFALLQRPDALSSLLHTPTILRTPTTAKKSSTPIPLGIIVSRYNGHSDLVSSVTWSPDSKRIASGSFDKTVHIWDASTGNHLLTYQGHSDMVSSVSWSRDGKSIASASSDKTVHIWDTDTGNHLLTYQGHSSGVNSVGWSPDGKQIASSDSNGTIQVWNPSTGNTLFTFHSPLQLVYSVAWSPDSTRIASRAAASPVSPMDANVQVWDTSNGNLIYTQVDHNTTGGSVAWSPNGRYLAAGNSDPSPQTIVWVLDASTGHPIFTYKGHTLGVNGLAWSPDGTYIASGSYDQTVQLWNATTGTMLYRKDHSTFIFGVAWSPNGAFIACGGGGNKQGQTVFVWTA